MVEYVYKGEPPKVYRVSDGVRMCNCRAVGATPGTRDGSTCGKTWDEALSDIAKFELVDKAAAARRLESYQSDTVEGFMEPAPTTTPDDIRTYDDAILELMDVLSIGREEAKRVAFAVHIAIREAPPGRRRSIQ